LIADEPTTALDVTIQAQVLELMNNLRREFRSAILFITHDLGVIAGMADDVAVMYIGKIVEIGPVRSIFRNPTHPYTQGLMNSIPSLSTRKEKRLIPIKGGVPDLLQAPVGCGFSPRCPIVKKICLKQPPALSVVTPDHRVACWLNENN
jgi:oligopeptide/dipeptide ABC transporter ATP-binding protein